MWGPCGVYVGSRSICVGHVLLALHVGELSCSPGGDRSRARLGEHLTLEDLEISTPGDLMPKDEQADEGGGSGWTHATTLPVPTPGSSCPTGSATPTVGTSQVSPKHLAA